MDSLAVGVLGIGTVGSAVADGFMSLGYTVRRLDPAKGFVEDLRGSDVLFICVYDPGLLENILKTCHKHAKTIVIKTTCPPGTTQKLIEKFGDHIVFSPEFLCEKSAPEDFLHPDKVVLGTENQDVADYLIELFLQFNCRILVMKPIEAELLKLAINSFYSVKVTFANDVADVCEAHGANYEAVRTGMEDDRFIARQHLDVNHGGYRGFGGKCLPKDIGMYIEAGGGVLACVADSVNRKRKEK